MDDILDTFPIIERKDEAKCGTHRTKDLILEVCERTREGENFTSALTPPPGHGPRHDPA